MNQMKIIEELKNDKEFIEKLSLIESNEEAVNLFASKGIEVTCDDLQAIRDGNISEELNENLLDKVVGGYGILVGVAALCFLAGFARGSRCK